MLKYAFVYVQFYFGYYIVFCRTAELISSHCFIESTEIYTRKLTIIISLIILMTM